MQIPALCQRLTLMKTDTVRINEIHKQSRLVFFFFFPGLVMIFFRLGVVGSSLYNHIKKIDNISLLKFVGVKAVKVLPRTSTQNSIFFGAICRDFKKTVPRCCTWL